MLKNGKRCLNRNTKSENGTANSKGAIGEYADAANKLEIILLDSLVGSGF